MSISIEDRLFPVAEDIKGLRLPMPPPLEWVNVYFLRHENGWFMVDTGYHTPESREILETFIDQHLDNKPIVGLIVTHYHPDHSGQAGWICERFQCPLYMSTNEWLLARWLSTDHSESYRKVITDYYRDSQAPTELVQAISERGNSFLSTSVEIPAHYKRIENHQELTIGDRTWRVHIGRGHAPEMILLHDEQGKLLISADQVVARITPNISVWAYDTDANPLADFLETARTLPQSVPNDVTILPGHGRPFEDLHGRLASYLTFHENRLNKFRVGLTGEAQSLYELTKIIFVRDLTPRDLVFAIGETHAHVNYLVSIGEVEIVPDKKLYFRKI